MKIPRISRNYTETVTFHKISTPGNKVKLRYYTQCLCSYIPILIHTCNKTLLNILDVVLVRPLFWLVFPQTIVSVSLACSYAYMCINDAWLLTRIPTHLQAHKCFAPMCLCNQIVCIPTRLFEQISTYTFVPTLERFKDQLSIIRDSKY